MRKLTGIGRNELITLIHALDKATAENKIAIAKLESEITYMRKSTMQTKGWFCEIERCKLFNGEEKERRATCRGCGIVKPF